jgi:hypothetical protein
MHARFFAVALTALMLAPVALAAAPASPQTLPLGQERHVYAELALAQPSLTRITLTGDLHVYRYVIEGDVYDADDIADAYNGLNKYNKRTGEEFALAAEDAVRDALVDTLASSFPDADVSGVTASLDRASLAASGGNPFDPPTRLSASATVDRTREDVGLGTLTDAAVAAAFAAGARLIADFELAADPGYRIVYAIRAPATPAGLAFLPGTGVSADATTLTVDVDNTASALPKRAASARLLDPSVTPPTSEDIRTRIDVQMGEAGTGDAALPITIDVAADIRSLGVTRRFSNALPPKVELAFVNADGVRALRATSAITDADLAEAEAGLLAETGDSLAAAFGSAPVVTGGLTAIGTTVPPTPYRADPPLMFTADAATSYAIEGATADDLTLALRIGGAAAIDLTLAPANGGATTYTLHPPAIGEFVSADVGTLSADGQMATFVVPGPGPLAASVSLGGKDVPRFTAEDAQMAITVDLQDLDVGLGRAMGGDFGDLVIALTVRSDLKVIALPDSLRATLPESLQLDYLAADSIRLLLDAGKITEQDLADLETRLLGEVEQNLGAALGGAVPASGGFDRATLAASRVSSPISSDDAVVFSATANVRKPLAGGELQTQAAIALYSQSLPLRLPKVQGLDTVYTVILPRGLAVTDLQGTGGDFERGEAPDGRDQFTVRPTSDAAEITATMAVTPTFVLVKFWPIVLLAVILLVLIVGTPIALVRMRKRKAQ